MRWLAYMTRIRMGTFSTIGTPFFFRLSNAKMMFRLIFIIGCVWNSTPKYTPNIWNSKRYSERFRFTMYSKLCVIISNLQFYDISWMYRFESFYLLPFIEAIICHTSDKNGDKYISQLYCLIEISWPLHYFDDIDFWNMNKSLSFSFMRILSE